MDFSPANFLVLPRQQIFAGTGNQVSCGGLVSPRRSPISNAAKNPRAFASVSSYSAD
jgi:hypothetical protein